MSRMCCRKYWKEDFRKPCWNDGLFYIPYFIFWLFRKLSLCNCLTFAFKSARCKYLAVDSYITAWSIAALILSILLSRSCVNPCCVILGFASYRLWDIFQTWVGNFVLHTPNMKNQYRTLVVTLLGYGEIILWYTIIVFTLKESFPELNCFQNAFYYSLTIATVGNDTKPIGAIGFTVLSTQLMFAILFLTVVINRILNPNK